MPLGDLVEKARASYGSFEDVNEAIKEETGADRVNVSVSDDKTSVHLTYYNE